MKSGLLHLGMVRWKSQSRSWLSQCLTRDRLVHAAAAWCSPSPCMQNRHPHTWQLTHPSMLCNAPHHPLRDDHRGNKQENKSVLYKNKPSQTWINVKFPCKLLLKGKQQTVDNRNYEKFQKRRTQASTNLPP